MHPTQTLPVHEADPTTTAPTNVTRRFDGAPETGTLAAYRQAQAMHRRPGDPVDEIGTCNICGTSGTLVRRTTDPDPRVPQMACVDTATCMSHFAEPVMVTPAVTLRAAALYLDRHGWIQGGYYEQTDRSVMPAACLVGAVGMVCYGSQVDAPAQHFDHPGFGDFETAVAYMDSYLCEVNPYDTDVYSFNDTPARTADQVTTTLRAAADQWDRTQGGAA